MLAYCLVPNHVHLILVASEKEGLKLAFSEAHRRYTRMINFREGWRGHLWQGRFASFIMDEKHLVACTKYVELNPVRAGLVKSPQNLPWSSAGPHIKGEDDALLKTQPLLDMIHNHWKIFLGDDVQRKETETFRKHERTGRPIGTDSFIQ